MEDAIYRTFWENPDSMARRKENYSETSVARGSGGGPVCLKGAARSFVMMELFCMDYVNSYVALFTCQNLTSGTPKQMSLRIN